MRIKDFFSKHPEHLVGFRKVGTTYLLDFWLDEGWNVNIANNEPEYQEKFSIEGGESKHKTNNKYYFMLNSDVLDHDELFKLFELILQKNIEVIKKKELLHEKMDELKNLFNELDYDVLRSLNLNVINKQIDTDIKNQE
jgi:hypothetical protein